MTNLTHVLTGWQCMNCTCPLDLRLPLSWVLAMQQLWQIKSSLLYWKVTTFDHNHRALVDSKESTYISLALLFVLGTGNVFCVQSHAFHEWKKQKWCQANKFVQKWSQCPALLTVFFTELKCGCVKFTAQIFDKKVAYYRPQFTAPMFKVS